MPGEDAYGLDTRIAGRSQHRYFDLVARRHRSSLILFAVYGNAGRWNKLPLKDVALKRDAGQFRSWARGRIRSCAQPVVRPAWTPESRGGVPMRALAFGVLRTLASLMTAVFFALDLARVARQHAALAQNG